MRINHHTIWSYRCVAANRLPFYPPKDKAPWSILAFLSAAKMSQGAFCKLLYFFCLYYYDTIVNSENLCWKRGLKSNPDILGILLLSVLYL